MIKRYGINSIKTQKFYPIHYSASFCAILGIFDLQFNTSVSFMTTDKHYLSAEIGATIVQTDNGDGSLTQKITCPKDTTTKKYSVIGMSPTCCSTLS
jgi:hypothetical protein